MGLENLALAAADDFPIKHVGNIQLLRVPNIT